MTAGPLSMPCKDKAKFRSLDTAEKRDNAGSFTTGKTALSHSHHPASDEQMMEQANRGHSNNLAARLRAFNASQAGKGTPTKFHRPGSNKK